jgi:hypothetical protein
MTFAEVELYCKGYETRMARLKEVPRLIAAVLINVNRRKGQAAMKPEDILPLYTDRHRNVELMSKEEYEKAKELSKRVKWNRN